MILLTNQYSKRNEARAVPNSHWEPKVKHWVVDDGDLTPKGAVVIAALFPEVAAKHPEVYELRETLLSDARPFDNATGYNRRIAEQAPGVRAALQADGHDFYEFQDIDLGYLADVIRMHKSGYIGWERGMGKTLAACALTEALGWRRVLVVCPNTAKETVWQPEVKRFLGRDVLVMPNGSPAKRKKLMEKLGPDTILVVHYEAVNLVAKERKDGHGWDKYGEWDAIVVDEGHRLANPQTRMHMALRKVPAKHRVAMSGSMIQNHPEEIFGPLKFLFPKVYARQWPDWNDRFLWYVKGNFGKILIGPHPNRIDALREELGVFTVYRRKKDELDLPQKTIQTLHVDLSKAQRDAYEDLRDSYVATLDSGESVVAIQPVVMLTRLRQIASGLNLVADRVEDSSKVDLALDLIRDDADEPYVVFTWFKASAELLAERLRADGEETYVVTGDTKAHERTRQIAEFQAGRGRVFIGTISTLGESVNLHRAANAIRLDRSWNPAANEQAEDRLYRIGQDRPVTITDIVARDTVDDLRVTPRLNDKDALRRAILGGGN